MNNNKDIVKGYKGILDLDLKNIPEQFKKDVINIHLKDIEEYKIYQHSLPPKLRYENTTLKAYNILKKDKYALAKRSNNNY